MSFKVSIPKYNTKDTPIMIGSMFVLALILNFIIFDEYFSRATVFIWASIVTFCILIPVFALYGMVAISLRSRFPDDAQTIKRLLICICILFLLSSVIIALILIGYEATGFLGYEFSEDDYTHCYIVTIVMNVFLIFLNEGVAQFDRYKTTLIATEQLKKEFLQSQLLGLKSQMNPHFLFNSLNTLSSLIHEDSEKAEDFLDHMSKVYRYLLRNNEDELVPLKTEIDLIRSYYFLLRKRHGQAFNIDINIPEQYLNTEIPPLTLQMLIENAVNQNTLTKNAPLNIFITVANDQIEIVHNVQPKLYGAKEGEEAIENIANKFRLLTKKNIIISETNEKRTIQLPLLEQKEVITE
jgi:sensor histidine kinase YesM